MDGLLHLVQRWGDWAGPQPAQVLPRCTKCNSPHTNGQCTNFILFDVALYWSPKAELEPGHGSVIMARSGRVSGQNYIWTEWPGVVTRFPVEQHYNRLIHYTTVSSVRPLAPSKRAPLMASTSVHLPRVAVPCVSMYVCLCDYNTYYKCNNGRPARSALAFLVACHCCLHFVFYYTEFMANKNM